MTVSTTLVIAFPPASFDDECERLHFNTFLLESTVAGPDPQSRDLANFPQLIQLVRVCRVSGDSIVPFISRATAIARG